MAKLFIEDTSLTAIGDAIRAKTGSTDKMSPAGMVTAIEGIEGGGNIPLEITGSCAHMFSNDNWNWYIEQYGDKITTTDITLANDMFSTNGYITSIPFSLNFDADEDQHLCTEMFYYCSSLESIGNIVNLKPESMERMFTNCRSLRYLPTFENLDLSAMYVDSLASLSYLFRGCYSLREIPEELLEMLCTPNKSSYSSVIFYYGFYNCYALDEIRGLNPQTSSATSNMFRYTFDGCSRVKNITFALQSDSTPYVVEWANQTIDLTECVGYCAYDKSTILGSLLVTLNNGLTEDTLVTTASEYNALKNSNDWWTNDPAFSRFNLDSAKALIETLPDTSAFLESNGGTNTLKLVEASGQSTDAGAVGALDETYVALAASKGWTISLT